MVFKSKNKGNTIINMESAGHGTEARMVTTYEKGDYKVELIEYNYGRSILAVSQGNHQNIIGHEREEHYNPTGTDIYEVFKQYTGYTDTQIMKFIQKRNNPKNCPKCGSHKSRWESGFPGETYRICNDCDNAIGYNFNRSAIM